MKNNGFRRSIFAFAVASALVLGMIGPQSILAYFTTHAEARGVQSISLYYETEIKEKVEGKNKLVQIESTDDSIPLYVRVKAFSEYQVSYEDKTGSWLPGDNGYYYYQGILEGGQTTPAINVSITTGQIPADVETGDTFDIIVVYEVMPVVYELIGGELKPNVERYSGYGDANMWDSEDANIIVSNPQQGQ
jgi:hypothetical protein